MVVKNIIKSSLMIPLSCLSVLSRLEERKKKFMISILNIKGGLKGQFCSFEI